MLPLREIERPGGRGATEVHVAAYLHRSARELQWAQLGLQKPTIQKHWEFQLNWLKFHCG